MITLISWFLKSQPSLNSECVDYTINNDFCFVSVTTLKMIQTQTLIVVFGWKLDLIGTLGCKSTTTQEKQEFLRQTLFSSKCILFFIVMEKLIVVDTNIFQHIIKLSIS